MSINRPRLVGSALLLVILVALFTISADSWHNFIHNHPRSEANYNLRKIFDGAVLYYEGALKLEAKPYHQFPASTLFRSPNSFACLDGVHKKHPPERFDAWNPTWRALQFEIEDEFYMSYSFISSGVGEDAMFTARAEGDLDCDGESSLFERIATVKDGKLQGSAGIYKENELE